MYREKIKVFDCTIRDGGLINNHDFDMRFVKEVYKALSEAVWKFFKIRRYESASSRRRPWK